MPYSRPGCPGKHDNLELNQTTILSCPSRPDLGMHQSNLNLMDNCAVKAGVSGVAGTMHSTALQFIPVLVQAHQTRFQLLTFPPSTFTLLAGTAMGFVFGFFMGSMDSAHTMRPGYEKMTTKYVYIMCAKRILFSLFPPKAVSLTQTLCSVMMPSFVPQRAAGYDMEGNERQKH